MRKFPLEQIEPIFEWLERDGIIRCGDPGTYVPTYDEIKDKLLPYFETVERSYAIEDNQKIEKLMAYLCWLSEAGDKMEPGTAQLLNDFITARIDDEDY